MNNKSTIHTLLVFFLFFSFPSLLSAQVNDVEMADIMRSDGKIYVVVAVLSVILASLLIFLIRIDRKVNRIENELKKD